MKIRARFLPAWQSNLVVPAVLLVSSWQAQAVHFTNSLVGPPTWRYDITYDPLDNYSIYQTNSTITITGLTGVTAAAGPTSTDFPPPYADATNLAWTAQVLNGGTTVVWTHVGPGTGNYPTTMHVYGFSITAAGVSSRSVSFSTSGFSRDTGNPLPGGGFNLDISGTVPGPSNGAPATPAPPSLLLGILGLGCAGAYQARERLLEWFRARS